MTTAISQPDDWYTARQLADTFPGSIGRMNEIGLQRLATLAAMTAKRLGVTPRMTEQPHHRYRAVMVQAFPRSVWMEARGVLESPSGLAPVPTLFDGIMFRSRLEARTAVALTSMGWTYEYEPGHAELPSGNYLPDFKVMFEDDWTWLELKSPHKLAEGRDPRWSELVRRTHWDLVVVYGLWRPVPFADSGKPRTFRGTEWGEYDVRWSEVAFLYPEGASNEITRRKLITAFAMLRNKRDKNPPKKHGNIPL